LQSVFSIFKQPATFDKLSANLVGGVAQLQSSIFQNE
jgi:hypothetical protein